ncbi:hypothetical protein DAEQUDRAFT_666305 [Daedalea quercina L-15889]|uniref:WD40 repeat-like protein n=1 Tax=Daedalea quercina L-15889 TaxID=1314783 RepID=A0A165RYE4_9APHY|nr:hypothetical protein DAEQUDRAFT_666305 [Daedalea quercina L-15889]
MQDSVLLVGCGAWRSVFELRSEWLRGPLEDGTVRMYSPSSTKVARAIKSLGAEISSICHSKPGGRQLAQSYFASGTKIFGFPQACNKMILIAQDASVSFALGEDDEDVLNEVDLSHDGKYLAFSTDNGTVGVVELSTGYVTRMRTRHTNICGSVRFIPDRPNELVSGGYDCKLLHHDFQQRTLLSEFDLSVFVSSPHAEACLNCLSPPFVLSAAIASTGLFAATTASGLAFVGAGGEKLPLGHGKKKRRRRWEGLNESEGQLIKVAEGPVVAVAFRDPRQAVTCTLLGELKLFTVDHDDPESDPGLSCRERWTSHTQNIAKVNAMVITGDRMCVGGLTGGGKGVVEVWDVSTEVISRTTASEASGVSEGG